MKQYHNTMDVVHGRCISSGIEDLGAFFEEAYNLLKPGGVFLYVDGCPPLVGPDYVARTGTDETSAVSTADI